MNSRAIFLSGFGGNALFRSLVVLTLLVTFLIPGLANRTWATVPHLTVAPLVHRVKAGDTLYGIARRFGLRVTDLKRLNHLTSNLIKPGQRLRLAEEPSSLPLPQAVSAPPAEPGVPSGPGPGDDLATAALDYLAIPYRFGGNDKRGLDCSAFAQRVFRDRGIELPRTAREQFHMGTEVPPEQLTTGDLLFFRTYAAFPSHVGIYLGDGKMVHASVRSRRIVVSAIDSPYFRSRYLGARRLGPEMPALADFDDLPQESGEEDPLAADPAADDPPR